MYDLIFDSYFEETNLNSLWSTEIFFESFNDARF